MEIKFTCHVKHEGLLLLADIDGVADVRPDHAGDPVVHEVRLDAYDEEKRDYDTVSVPEFLKPFIDAEVNREIDLQWVNPVEAAGFKAHERSYAYPGV